MMLSLQKKNLLIIIILTTFLCSIQTDDISIPKDHYVSPEPSVHFPIEFNATKAYEHIRVQLEFGFRVPGTVEHDMCVDWIREELQSVTETVISHNFSLPGPDETLIHCQNVLGKLNIHKSNIIIIAAHWDTRAIAEKDIINTTQPIPGANDGASGVAVILELARVFFKYKDEFDSQIWFLFFDAEDQGSGGIPGWNWAEGANAFSDSIDQFHNNATEQFSFFLLLDMVGGYNLEFMDEGYSNNELQDAVFQEGRELGYTQEFPRYPTRRYVTDDHVYFRNLMPTLDLIIDFISGPWDHHHTHQDNLENIDKNSLYVTGSTIESFIYSYHGKTTWNQNYTKWIIISAVGAIGFAGGIGTYLFLKKRKIGNIT